MTEQRAPPKPKSTARQMLEALLFAIFLCTACMLALLLCNNKL